MAKGLRKRQERRKEAVQKVLNEEEKREQQEEQETQKIEDEEFLTAQRTLKRAGNERIPGSSAVLKLSHLHPCFAEGQLRKFCSEFGEVRRIRVIRSRKTGGSTGRAYVEFHYPEVAEIVARALNNYYLGGELIRANVVEGEVPPMLWRRRGFLTRDGIRAKARRAVEQNAARPSAKRLEVRARHRSKLIKKLETMGLREVFEGSGSSLHV